MTKLQLRNLTNRIEKIPLTKLFRTELGYELDSAKKLTDDLLDGHSIELDFVSIYEAEMFAGRVEKLGVSCKVLGDND